MTNTNTNANPATVAVTQVTNRTEQKAGDRHYTNISAPAATLAACVFTAIIVVLGWIAVHLLTLKREREARTHSDRREKESSRSDLLSTLSNWERRFVVVTDPQESKRIYYSEGMRALATAAEKFRGHVADKATFDDLNHRMSDMNPQTLDANGADNRRDTICSAIRKFQEFIRAA